MKYKLTIYETDDTVTYEFDNASDIIKQLESIEKAEKEKEKEKEKERIKAEKSYTRPLTPYERTRRVVYATGNKWAIENFNATH